MTYEHKNILLRLDPAVHDALVRWAGDELRSANPQIEFLLRCTLGDSRHMRCPGRPSRSDTVNDSESGSDVKV